MQRFFGTQNLRRINSFGSKSESHVTDALIGRLTAPPTGSFAYVRPRQMSRWRWWASAFFFGPSDDRWTVLWQLTLLFSSARSRDFEQPMAAVGGRFEFLRSEWGWQCKQMPPGRKANISRGALWFSDIKHIPQLFRRTV